MSVGQTPLIPLLSPFLCSSAPSPPTFAGAWIGSSPSSRPPRGRGDRGCRFCPPARWAAALDARQIGVAGRRPLLDLQPPDFANSSSIFLSEESSISHFHSSTRKQPNELAVTRNLQLQRLCPRMEQLINERTIAVDRMAQCFQSTVLMKLIDRPSCTTN